MGAIIISLGGILFNIGYTINVIFTMLFLIFYKSCIISSIKCNSSYRHLVCNIQNCMLKYCSIVAVLTFVAKVSLAYG